MSAPARLDVLPSAAACCPPLAAPTMSVADAELTASLFKALAEPARVRIVNLLSGGEPICVCELTPSLGLSQGTVSHHLKKLLDVGLLTREQRGVWAYYALDPEAMERLAAVVGHEGGN